MSRYITTKTDFTLRRKHKKGSGATIYENDYTTINPMPNALKGEYVIGDSNFVFTSRLGINAQKKHTKGKFVMNPSGSTDERGAWTIETIIDSGISEETRIRLKPNYSSIKDFACYGSAVKLVQGTINGVITDFPAEMYLSSESITIYEPDDGKEGYSMNDANSPATIKDSDGHNIPNPGKLFYNEYGIDIVSVNLHEESVYNPLRFFSLCGTSYVYIDTSNVEHAFVGYTPVDTSIGSCVNGKNVEIDKISEVKIAFEDGIAVTVYVFKDYETDQTFYTYSGGQTGGHIRPKKRIVEEYFRDCDDFTAVLLNREPKPIYTAVFETPYETETGFSYDMMSYVWPTINGGFNPDLSGPYYSYLESLIQLGEFYDEYYSDNMWRSLTHEAIKTLDWTYVSNENGEVEEMTAIDTSRVEPITKIYGRQFDDLKRYADGIKSVNTITYNQKSNAPDYVLSDILENSGWETKNLYMTGNKDIYTESLYSGLTFGYSEGDANTEFLRRLKLNSEYLLSVKGTRKGLDAMLGIFGFIPGTEVDPTNPMAIRYDIHENVYVFSGRNNHYPHFCQYTKDLPTADMPSYPLAKDVSTINKHKVNFNALDPYGDYCGIPVAEVGYEVGDNNYSYVIPWYNMGKEYDDGLYFQMYGGWGKRNSMEVDVEIAPDTKVITDMRDDEFPNGAVPLYMETQARMRFAKDFAELLQEAFSSANTHDVFYVTDISKISTEYRYLSDSEITGASHYFVLENKEQNQFLGYNSSAGEYGWRSIELEEIQENVGGSASTTAGTLVLYLESIKDDTTGNNPHAGHGLYDGGMQYVSGMSDIFSYSLINKNLIGINDKTCEQIKEYVFTPTAKEDNRKCWFFSDDYNFKYGKNVCKPDGSPADNAPELTFLEADITSGHCDVKKFYEVEKVLRKENQNRQATVGTDADSHFQNNDREGMSEGTYSRTTNLTAIDPEARVGKNGEAAANSIVNVKNLEIHFTLPAGHKEKMKRYIEISVIPYLIQMIPSTALLGWSFDEDSDSHITSDSVIVTGILNQVAPTELPEERLVVTSVLTQDSPSSLPEDSVVVTGILNQQEPTSLPEESVSVNGELTQLSS